MEAIKVLLIDDEQSTYEIVNHYCKKMINTLLNCIGITIYLKI